MRTGSPLIFWHSDWRNADPTLGIILHTRRDLGDFAAPSPERPFQPIVGLITKAEDGGKP